MQRCAVYEPLRSWHALLYVRVYVFILVRTKLLRRKFAERFSSPDARSDINYVAFLAAVDLAVAGHDKVRQTRFGQTVPDSPHIKKKLI